jgi:hypothetical protein
MKKIINYIFAFIFASSMFACTKVVNYDLVETDVRTVIEARMIKDSFALVRVTKTAPYLLNQPAPVVSNATVALSTSAGAVEILDYVGNGYYKGKTIVGSVGPNYGLTVAAEGKTYTAYTKILEAVPFTIAGVNYVDGKGTFKDEGYYPTIKATLPEDSYFLFNYFKNGLLYRKEKSDVWVTDSKFIGTNIDGLEEPYPYQVNDVAKIHIYRITKEAFNFYDDLGAQLVNDGGFFSTPPSNTSTNFTNGAIGLFLGGALYTQSITITP